MSFGAELIGFSLALGTNDVVVTGKRSIVVPTGQFVRVNQPRTSRITIRRRDAAIILRILCVHSPTCSLAPMLYTPMYIITLEQGSRSTEQHVAHLTDITGSYRDILFVSTSKSN